MEELFRLLNSLSITKWGIADISNVHELGLEYPRAISLLMSYSYSSRVYNGKKLDEEIASAREKLNKAIQKIQDFLQEKKIKHYVVSNDRKEANLLIGFFPHKLAATSAGMGWIGKNALLITEDYGPRVRLATVLVDMKLSFNEPIRESRCGECRRCIDSCPFNCLKNVSWNQEVNRESIIDISECRGNKDYKLKYSCGRCLVACLKGIKAEGSPDPVGN